MSRFGNVRMPAATDEPDVLHGWALVDHSEGALTLFHALERQLEEVAEQLHVVIDSAPTYETFLLTDPGVPASVRTVAEQLLPTTGPTWAVHTWAHFRARTQPAAAAEVAELYDVPAAELDAALIGGGPA
jgi:hypothetical protein